MAILDLSVEKQAKTKEACKKQGVKVGVYACDVTDQEAVQKTFDKIEEELAKLESEEKQLIARASGIEDIDQFEEFGKFAVLLVGAHDGRCS